ncbi:Ig-like domain-containing protein [Streptomyces sp. AC555_RSS877]|uniref:Ig-like domain-containing protein n=1 Tax=Streptomyces sp. AC555_RSS877 TaxID=2823688 RepID=UPI001C27EA12|nr:Ig-like domain-containing protein [Streptomyces sp. AC555_RSS877]
MNGPRRATGVALAGIAVVGTMTVSGPPPQAAAAAPGRELTGAVTIAPGREGVVQVAGYAQAAPAVGSALTLTAPGGSKVTGVPFAGRGYRGAVMSGGSGGSYTFVEDEGVPGVPAAFPFVLAVASDAVPGTRLRGCVLRLTDARGAVKERGTCEVTVGLPGPTLTRPESGVPLTERPEVAGTAYPGAQVTVRDALENEVCATTAAADGTWSCVPGTALPAGSGRLQATATLNGVGATSEQITITVGPAGRD